ncbi:MAG: LacI family DNA-binding transcriptional regulator, partial [Puniceicoccales bacterium]
MKVTMQQIAQELDYSQSTVSRSLRHDSSISPETKANVFAVAHRLGYKVRSPKPQKRAKTCWHVGLLYSGEDEKIKAQDTVLARLLEGIVQEAESAGVRINLHLTKPHLDNKHSGIEHMPSLMRERKADALVIQGANHNEEDILRYSKSFPIVSFNRIYRGLGLDCVVSENMWSVKCLVEKLISLGHRQMCWIKA